MAEDALPSPTSSAQLRTMFASHRLPPNSELHKLPPLPETPAHRSTHPLKLSNVNEGFGGSCNIRSYHRTTAASFNLKDLAQEPVLDDEDVHARTPVHDQNIEKKAGAFADSSGTRSPPSSLDLVGRTRWEVDVDYPILSTRQGGVVPPVGRTPSRDYSKGMGYPTLRVTSTQPKTKEAVTQHAWEREHGKEHPLNDGFQPDTSSVELKRFFQARSIPLPSSPPLVPVQTSSDTAAAQTPVSLTRDVDEGRQRSQVDSQILSHAQAEHEPHPQPQPRLSASFNLPTYGDASLIADASLMGGATSSNGDDNDSFEFGINKLRQFPPSLALSTQLEAKEDTGSSGSDTPKKRSVTHYQTRENLLDQSTLLPRSAAKSAHLMASTNALCQVQPPWASDDSDVFSSSTSTIDGLASPERRSESPEKMATTQSMKGFPASNSSHSTITNPVKPKRTSPASSSGQSLASVGEEPEYLASPVGLGVGDVSTLLPVSPVKAAHLMSDAEMITKETLAEEASFRLPLPPRATPFKSATLARHTPRRSPIRSSPFKTAVRVNAMQIEEDEGDVTFDVKDLMAKVGKPKRASGTEESFADLLHDDFMPDGFDASMLGPDESMLHPQLRVRSSRATSVSPRKPFSAHSPIQPTSRVPNVPSTSKKLPTSQSSRGLSSRTEDEEVLESRQSTISRSKSLSRVAEIIERVRTDRAAQTQAALTGLQKQEAQASPPKTAIRTRTYTTIHESAAPAVTPGFVRPRMSMMPPLATSRRISLSTGALPMPTSASHRLMELPPPSHPSHTRTASTGSRSATVVAVPAIVSSIDSCTTLATTSQAPTTASSRAARALPTTATRETIPARARPSVAPTSRLEQKSRTGSASSTVSRSAAAPALSAARTATATRTTFRPSSTAASSASARSGAAADGATSTTHMRMARPSVSARPAGLPRPGAGPTARSAPSTTSASASAAGVVAARARPSRAFGADATSGLNRVPRPSTAAVTAGTTKVGSKLSTGPDSSTATSSRLASMKSRALSTPASTVTSSSVANSSRVPPVPALPGSSNARLTRPSFAPTRTGETQKSSMPPPSSIIPSAVPAAAPRPRGGSTLPPPRSTRLPSTQAGSKMSAPPSSRLGTTGGSVAAPGAPKPGLAALRTRLDALQAKQVKPGSGSGRQIGRHP